MKEVLRVTMLTSSFPRWRGDSAGAFLLCLAAELSKREVQVNVIAPHDDRSSFFEVWDNVRVFRHPYFFPLKYQKLCYSSGILTNIKKKPALALQLPFLVMAQALFTLWGIKKAKTDLIHAHWSIPQGFSALLAQRVGGIPYVLSMHGSDVFALNRPFFNFLNRAIINHAGKCSANSGATREMAQLISGREDIEIIPMGVDTNVFKPVRGDKTRWDSRADEKIILFVGRLIEVKGLTYLLEALTKVFRVCREARAVIVGSGPQKERLLALSKGLKLEKQVSFIGAIAQNELPAIYSAADVFVLPSVVSESGEREGLGVVLLEAMACGSPVIGTNTGGIPDIVKHEETGLIALERNPDDLADKILRILLEDELRGKLKRSALCFVRGNFSWSTIAAKFKKVYEGVLRKGL